MPAKMLEDLIELRENLRRVLEKLDSMIESLEIMSDAELMESIERAKNQKAGRDFEEFLKELQNS